MEDIWTGNLVYYIGWSHESEINVTLPVLTLSLYKIHLFANNELIIVVHFETMGQCQTLLDLKCTSLG